MFVDCGDDTDTEHGHANAFGVEYGHDLAVRLTPGPDEVLFWHHHTVERDLDAGAVMAADLLDGRIVIPAAPPGMAIVDRD